MSKSSKPLWHIMTPDEVTYSTKCIEKLRSVPWAAPLLKSIDDQGGPSSLSSRTLLFEVRFAYELYRSGITPIYEYKAGIGDTAIDFAIKTETAVWLIELVCADETEALTAATREQDLIDPSGDLIDFKAQLLELKSDAKDQRLTEAGEMIKIQEKLYEKVQQKGQPHKFPVPDSNFRHAIIVDARGFLGGEGPSDDDTMQILYSQVNQEWQRQSFDGIPLKGVFDSENTRRGAKLLQERIHLIGIVVEKEFGPGKLREQAAYRPNLLLSGNDDVFESFPLKRSTPVVQ